MHLTVEYGHENTSILMAIEKRFKSFNVNEILSNLWALYKKEKWHDFQVMAINLFLKVMAINTGSKNIHGHAFHLI